MSDGARICIPPFGLGGSIIDGMDLCDDAAPASVAWSIGRAVEVSSNIDAGGFGVGSTKGPRSTADVDEGGIAVPFARASLINGDASGCSGRAGLEGDELPLLSGRSIVGPALLDWLGAGENKCKF
jgi:hypothetical protein